VTLEGEAHCLRASLKEVVEEADRLRGWLQSSYPRTHGGHLIGLPEDMHERIELLSGASTRARALLAEGEEDGS
jgi:hypothetical protein